MARHESDREDLMREATALTRRVELEILEKSLSADAPSTGARGDARSGATTNESIASSHTAPHVVLGFRDAAGWFSVYFEQDPVYTFDAEGRLRRAVEAGFLYRAQGATLAKLERRRGVDEVELVRHDLTPDELDAFLSRMHDRLGPLRGALERGTARVGRLVGERSSLLSDASGALARILAQTTPIADSLPGKK